MLVALRAERAPVGVDKWERERARVELKAKGSMQRRECGLGLPYLVILI